MRRNRRRGEGSGEGREGPAGQEAATAKCRHVFWLQGRDVKIFRRCTITCPSPGRRLSRVRIQLG